MPLQQTAQTAEVYYRPPADMLPDQGKVWVCQHCGDPFGSVGDLRDHLTDSGDDLHVGLNGYSLERDMVAFGPDGSVVEVRPADYTDTEDGLEKEHGRKKKEVVNAWYAGFPDVSEEAIRSITSAGKQYISRIFSELENEEMSPREIEQVRDDMLQRRMSAELDRYDRFGDLQVEYVDVGEEPEQAIAISQEGDQIMAEQTTDANVSLDDYKKLEKIYNAWLLAPDIHYSAIGTAAGSSDEYARKETKAIKEGKVTVEDLEDVLDVDLQQALLTKLQDEEPEALEEADASVKTDVSQVNVNFDIPTERDIAEAPSPPDYGVQKKEVIANIHALDGDVGQEVAASIADCSEEYARQKLHDIEAGEISPRQYESWQNERVKKLIQDFVDEAGISLGEEEKSEDEGSTAATPEADSGSFSVDNEAVRELAEGMSAEEAREIVDSGTVKKKTIINAYLSPFDIEYEDAAEMASSTSEHGRRTYNQIESGGIDEEEQQSAADNEVMAALGVLHEQQSQTAESQQVQSTASAGAGSRPERSAADVDQRIGALDTLRGKEVVPASEVRELRSAVNAIKRFNEADGETDPKVDFITDEVVTQLDEILEDEVISLD